MDGRQYRTVASVFPTGVTVIATRTSKEGSPVGMTANSFTTLSLDPCLVLFNVDKKSSSYLAFMDCHSFSVNFLTTDQREIAQRFATHGVDRFAGCQYTDGTTGVPILSDILGYFECHVRQRYDGGDHTIVVGEVIEGQRTDQKPLVFYEGRYASIC